MKRLYALTGSFLFLVPLLLSFSAPSRAQSGAAVRSGSPNEYDASKEITLHATVSALPSAAANGGFQAKRQLTLDTGSGTIAAEVGRTALRGKFAIPLSSGKEVQVTGVMASRSGSQVMLVRTVQLDGHTYTVRNTLGSVLPHPIVDGSAALAFKGGAQ